MVAGKKNYVIRRNNFSSIFENSKNDFSTFELQKILKYQVLKNKNGDFVHDLAYIVIDNLINDFFNNDFNDDLDNLADDLADNHVDSPIDDLVDDFCLYEQNL